MWLCVTAGVRAGVARALRKLRSRYCVCSAAAHFQSLGDRWECAGYTAVVDVVEVVTEGGYGFVSWG
jgi:hypothetical protein